MLTGRGWGLLALAAVSTVVAGLVGVMELYGVAAGCVALVVAAAAWVHGRDWRLVVERAAHPGRVAAGEPAEVRVAAANPGPRSSPAVELVDPVDGGAGAARLAVGPLGPGGWERGAYRLAPMARGVHRAGPLEVLLTDPLGVARMRRVGAPVATITVLPRLERLVSLPPTGGDDPGGGVGGAALLQGGDEFFGLREYRVGDDLRRVHWAATARTGELVIRQEERRRRGQLAVLVDLRPGWAADALETALSAAASVLALAHRAGLDARLLDTAGLDTGPVPPGDDATLLDPLSLATPAPGAPPAAAVRAARLAPGADALVAILPAGAAADLAALAATGPWGRALTPVLVGTSGAGGPVRLGTGGPVRLVAGAPVAPAWEAAVGGLGGGRRG